MSIRENLFGKGGASVKLTPAPATPEPTPTPFYTRPSAKKEGVLVVGVRTEDGDRRVALLRLSDDGTVKVRSLNGNPREASSNTNTQAEFYLPVEDLTPDPIHI